MAINEQVSKALSDLFKDGMKGTGQSEEGMLFVAKNLMPLLAKPMVQQMGVGGSPVTMLDSACGAGVATDVARKLLAEGNALEGSRFVAADNSDKLVEIVKRRIEEEGWTNTEAKVLDAMVCRLSPHLWLMDGNSDLNRIRNYLIIHSLTSPLPWVFTLSRGQTTLSRVSRDDITA